MAAGQIAKCGRMLDAKTLDGLLTNGSGKLDRVPFIGLGTFELTLKEIRQKRAKGQTILVKGELIEVPGKVEAYFIEGRVETTTNPAKHPVGSYATVYLPLEGKYPESDAKNLFDFAQKFYECLGVSIVVGADAPAEKRAEAIENFRGLMGNELTNEHDETAARGVRMIIETNMPKATKKDGTARAKVPTEDGFLYKDWRAVKQTDEQVRAQAASLG